MPSSNPSNYLAGYTVALVRQVHQLIDQDQMGGILLNKYPLSHGVRTDKALYEYVAQIKSRHLRNAGQLSKVTFDNKLHIIKNALGTHSTISRVQGAKLMSKREIRISVLFKEMPPEFLRMIVVHELAHMKEHAHDKAFYQLCHHMEPEYPRLEFDLRGYLTYLNAGKRALWYSSEPARMLT
jgi:predicted metal-dependent hydrolase